MEDHKKAKRVVLRFYKPVPALVGPDMKTYGPFSAEDVASVPLALAEQIMLEGCGAKIDVPTAKEI
jgi:DNA replication factor GINS